MQRTRSNRAAALIAVGLCLLAACGDDSDTGAATTAAPVTAAPDTSVPSTPTSASSDTTTIDGTTTTGVGTTVTGSVSATTTPASRCTEDGPCKVGDIGPGGAIVFYVAPSPQPWGQYLEAPHANWNGGTSDPVLPLGCGSPGQNTSWMEDLGSELGDGLANTRLIAERCLDGGAASTAALYLPFENGAAVTDWYLPSLYELEQLLLQAALFRDLSTNQLYWSSTFYNLMKIEDCRGQCFFSAGIGSLTQPSPERILNERSDQLKVRPIRAFGPRSAAPPPTTEASTTVPSSPPDISVSPSGHDFGKVEYSPSAAVTITVKNVGGGTLKFTGFSFAANTEYFYITENGCTGKQLGAGKTCTIRVQVYVPGDQSPPPGSHSDTLRISSNGGTGQVNLSYNGPDAPPQG